MKPCIATAVLLLLALLLDARACAAEAPDNWHHWRGPNADGSAPGADPPTEWSQEKNIRWRVEIPGKGHATPVVWGDRIFVLTAVETDRKPGATDGRSESLAPEATGQPPRGRGQRGRGRRGPQVPETVHQFVVMCLDRKTGDVVWKRVAREEVPHEGMHSTSSFASLSPTTDGKRLYASFGSRGVFCYDLDGKLLWERDLGDMTTRRSFGEGTSPVVHGDALIHLWDHEGDSFLVCLDAKTGEERWRVARDEPTTWNTPLVVEHGGVTQVVANGANRTRSYDLASGKLLWECGGQAGNPIASPVAQDGLVFCMTGFRGYAVYAIPLDARGDITGTKKVAWKRDDTGPYVASPLLYDGLLYFTKSRNAILSCVDAKSGKVHYLDERLPGLESLYASPVGAGGKVYIVGRSGRTLVLRHGPKFEVLATNDLGETVDASPAIVGDEIFLRGEKHLYCIAEKS